MLAFDFNDRLTAAEALEHPYFNDTLPDEPKQINYVPLSEEELKEMDAI